MIRLELLKQTRRPRAFVTLGAVALISLLVTLVIAVDKPQVAERVGNFGSVISDTSGLTMPLVTLSALLLFLVPLVVAIFAGEAIAGEASWGSLRYLLARPVSRGRVLAAKALVAAAFSVLALLICVLVSLAAGTIAFGWHPLTVLDLEHTSPFVVAVSTFKPSAALARLALATTYVLGILASTFTFSLLLSTLTRRPFSAVAGGIGLSLFSRALDNVPGLHALGPWLPVTDHAATLWTGFFARPMQTADIAHVLGVQAGYIAIFTAAAVWRFTRSDVLS